MMRSGLLAAGLLLAGYLAASDWLPVQKIGEGVQTGIISGKIFKPNLAAAAGAKVTIDLGSDSKLTGTSDQKGIYMFVGVPAGTGYAVSARKDTLKANKKGVEVTAGKTTTVDLVLKNID